MIKNKYSYIVLCNPQPIVYGVYSNLKSAVKYAKSLIKYRFDNAAARNYEYGYYHLIEDNDIIAKNPKLNITDCLMFSACLKIKDNLKTFSEDACYVQVKRFIIKK